LKSDNSVHPSQKWLITLGASAQGNEIVIPAKALRAVRSGRAVLHVAAIAYQQPTDSGNELTYAVGQETTVDIVE